jgi:ATP synthase protein I
MAPNPDPLNDLGRRLDEAQRKRADAGKRPPPTQLGIAGRFVTELVAAVVVGGGLGWGIDWLLGRYGHQTSPVFLIVFFVLGAAAGIRNVMRAANEINADIAAKSVKEK